MGDGLFARRIFLGVALIAIGSAIAGLASRGPGGGGGGYSGASFAGSGTGGNYKPQRLYGDIVIQGSDLHLALSNYDRQRGRM